VRKSKSGKNSQDAAKAAADAVYIARAARVMRYVMVIAILATVVTLFLLVEPVVRMAWHGDLFRSIGERIEYRDELTGRGEIPPPLLDPNWQKWGLTVGGGVLMIVIFSGLYRTLRRLEDSSKPPSM
jgi:hypothetical protein